MKNAQRIQQIKKNNQVKKKQQQQQQQKNKVTHMWDIRWINRTTALFYQM